MIGLIEKRQVLFLQICPVLHPQSVQHVLFDSLLAQIPSPQNNMGRTFIGINPLKVVHVLFRHILPGSHPQSLQQFDVDSFESQVLSPQ